MLYLQLIKKKLNVKLHSQKKEIKKFEFKSLKKDNYPDAN
jgi:hypothetical protein